MTSRRWIFIFFALIVWESATLANESEEERIAQGHYLRANELIGQNRYREAVEYFSRSLAFIPEYADAYYGRGTAYEVLGEFKKALSDYDRALKINPKYAAVLYTRAELYSKTGKFNESLADWTTAIDLYPKYEGAYYKRAVVYSELQKFDLAWQDVQKAEELGYPVDQDFLSLLKTKSGRDQ